MPHAILHGMGMFAASNTYVRIRERDNNYIFMNPGPRDDQPAVSRPRGSVRERAGDHGEGAPRPLHLARGYAQRRESHERARRERRAAPRFRTPP